MAEASFVLPWQRCCGERGAKDKEKGGVQEMVSAIQNRIQALIFLCCRMADCLR